jgi:acyl transferase domain-containing protein/thioesterase domain-containing protein/acyl carrier protein
VDADTIDYVEAHGTGTAMGDPIEIAALSQAFRESTKRNQFCGIGSVKTNIGHLDTAAGVASLVKVCLALKKEAIPASLGFEKPNPSIDFEHSPFFVNHVLRPWPRGDKVRRATVNSLGVGGTNAHIILEEGPEPAPTRESDRPAQAFCLAARSKGALDDQMPRLAAYLKSNPDVPIADVTYTLFHGRRHFAKRRVLASESRDDAIRLLESPDPRRVFDHTAYESGATVAFMFPGGGAQYPRMAEGLVASEPEVQRWIDRGLEALNGLKPGFDLRSLWFPDDADLERAAKELWRPAVQLPAIYILSYALAQAWMKRGVEPKALIGHSMGENTAAAVAGVLTFEEGLGLVLLRGQLMEKVPRGGMLSVPLSADALRARLGPDLELGVVNGPELSVASGPVQPLENLAKELEADGIEAQRIGIDIAAHSRLLEPVMPEFEAYLAKCRLKSPSIPIVSNLTGQTLSSSEATSPEYWTKQLRHTVEFSKCLDTLLSEEGRVLLEVGPGRTLSSLARQQPKMGAGKGAVPSLRHPDEQVSDAAFFTAAHARLWALGVDVDPDAFWGGEQRRRRSLPTYAFQRQRYFYDPPSSRAADEQILPEKIPNLEDWFYAPRWVPRYAEAPEPDARYRWLVFMDDAGVGERLVERLEAERHTVITVWPGDRYVRTDSHGYRLAPEHGLLGHQELIDDLADRDLLPDRVVHLWSTTRDESFRPGSSFFHRNVEQGFYSLFHLAQALVAKDVERPMHVTCVSNGMQSVDGEAVAHPAKATLLGAVRVLPKELPNLTCSSLDVVLPANGTSLLASLRKRRDPLEDVVDAVLAEVLAAPANHDAALRDGVRYEQIYRPLRLDSRPSAPSVRQGGAYLITGGLGGIGLTIAEHLAKVHGANLILQGRTPLPPRERWDEWLRQNEEADRTSRRIRKIRDLEASGVDVLVGAMDVCDVHALRQLLEEAESRFGRVDGVFHAAGVLRDELVGMKQPVDVEEVFAPKVQGLRVLLDVLEDVDLVVLFSSTSAVVGLPGQTDYAAANAYLNAYAHHVRDRGRPRVVSVEWGVWRDVGLGADIARQMGRGGDAEISRAPVDHVLFSATARTKGGAIIFNARLNPKHTWILDEHRIRSSGRAVVPGSSYPEMALAGLRGMDVHGPVELRDLLFLDALGVDEDSERDVRARFKEKSGEWTFEIQSRRRLEDGTEGWQLHAQATAGRAGARPRTPLDVASIEARCPRVEATADHIVTPQEEHLAFGPRWQVLRQAARGDGEAVGRLSLSPEQAQSDVDWALHPGLFDIATGFALDLVPGYRGTELWVPIRYASLRIWDRLPDRVVSWVRLENHDARGGTATFDATITTEDGTVIAELEGMTMRRLEASASRDLGRSISASDLEIDKMSSELGASELAFHHQISQGILPAEGAEALHRVLTRDVGPEVMITSIPLEVLHQQAAANLDRATPSETFARPQLESDYVEPRDEIERGLADMWRELLGVDQVGVKDDFFELGGHSLIAVRMFARIRKDFRADFPIATLFDAPTIEQVGELVKSAGGEVTPEPTDAARTAEVGPGEEPALRHLVPMHPFEPPPATPFFIVAGMFGNVMNLRYLASHLGRDRPFYALQARGLYGGDAPHETFEEAAADYIAEIRRVQPHGPYLIGGFSGGGISAFEVAHQLRSAGEDVDLVVMLDTPLPIREQITKIEVGKVHLEALKKEGVSYLGRWAKSRADWELGRLKARLGLDGEEAGASEFHNQTIHDAFNRALERYALKPYPGRVVLFRPRLQAVHDFGGGRIANADRQLLYHDNGWTPWTAELDVFEVPGDHDSMVLEPNVRVVSRHIRRLLNDVESERAKPSGAGPASSEPTGTAEVRS